MHGELGDPAVEAKFLALLIAMFHYSDRRMVGVPVPTKALYG